MRIRRLHKRRTLALARLFAGLEAEARKKQPWQPGKAYRMSVGRT
jgi:hypothetical protein